MKILKRLLPTLLIVCCWIHLAKAQDNAPTLYDELNPYFTLELIPLSKKKNVNLVGRAPDGRLLVRSTPDDDPETLYRVPADYFWVSVANGKPLEEEIQKTDWHAENPFEMARLDENTLFWTKESKGEWDFYLKEKGAGKKSAALSMDSLPGKIRHPFIFQPRTSNFPMLLFSAKPPKRRDYDIFYSERKPNGVWSAPRPLTAKGINKTGSHETHPFVSENGTLFFRSDRIEGTGKKRKDGKSDLWAAVPTHKPYWQKATVNPLPPPFNTRGEERMITPYGPGFRYGFLISDSTEGPLKLYFFKSILKDTTPPPPRYYALVVGVQEYKSWPPLNCPVDECRQLARVLEKNYGFQVTRLENPDSTQFMDALGEYQGYGENEYLLVAFIGHGMQYLSEDKQRYVSQLVGRDAPECPTRTAELTTCAQAIPGSIDPNSFSKALGLQSKHILVIIDACRSGFFLPSEPQPGGEQKSRWVLSSTETSEVDDCGGFFSGLMKTLDDPVLGKNLDGKRLFEEIERFMHPLEGRPKYKHFPDSNAALHFQFPPRQN